VLINTWWGWGLGLARAWPAIQQSRKQQGRGPRSLAAGAGSAARGGFTGREARQHACVLTPGTRSRGVHTPPRADGACRPAPPRLAFPARSERARRRAYGASWPRCSTRSAPGGGRRAGEPAPFGSAGCVDEEACSGRGQPLHAEHAALVVPAAAWQGDALAIGPQCCCGVPGGGATAPLPRGLRRQPNSPPTPFSQFAFRVLHWRPPSFLPQAAVGRGRAGLHGGAAQGAAAG
jgi:hypothetical protein